MTPHAYGLMRRIPLPLDEAESKVRASLKAEGFGVLTEINVTATLKEKLGVDFGRPYVILGACNPQFAYQALQAELDLGLLLPCNVILYEEDGETVIGAVDPQAMMSVVPNEKLQQVAGSVKEKLARAIDNV